MGLLELPYSQILSVYAKGNGEDALLQWIASLSRRLR